MLHLPPLSQIVEHAFGPSRPNGTNSTIAQPINPSAVCITRPAGHLAALLEIQESIEPAFVRNAEQPGRQDLRNRARIDTLLARLQAGGGIAPFNETDPTGPHFCFHLQDNVLRIASHAALLTGQAPAFEIHLHGPGVMTRKDDAWVENPDAAFFEALDAACRSAQQAFIV